jgi:hypothetical protein
LGSLFHPIYSNFKDSSGKAQAMSNVYKFKSFVAAGRKEERFTNVLQVDNISIGFYIFW